MFSIDTVDDGLPEPSYNIAPSQQISIVVDAAGRDDATSPVRRLVSARWGLVPRFAVSMSAGPTPFNARVEKLAASPLYRGPLARRRTIVPADGFYERRRTDRQSFYIHPVDDTPLALAGLYEWWRPNDSPGVPWLLTATIITRDAQAAMADIHDRQPLYLPHDLWDEWLDPAAQGGRQLVDAVMGETAAIAERLDYRPVGSAWLSTRPGQRRDDSGLID